MQLKLNLLIASIAHEQWWYPTGVEMFKRACPLLVLVMIFTMASAFSSENSVRIQIRPASEAIQQIRYQSGIQPGKSWKDAPLEVVPLVLEGFASETEFMFAQQAIADGPWSDIFTYQYDPGSNTWSLAGSQGEAIETDPRKIGDDVSDYPSPLWRLGGYGAMLFNGKDAAHLYTNSFGGGIELSVNYPKFVFSANAEAHVAQSNNTLWADRYTILALTGGVGYPLLDSRKSELDVVGRYGLIVHHNRTDWYFNQRAAAGLRYSYGISGSLRPFVEGDVGVMFTKSLVTMMCNASVGLQYIL